MAEVATSTRKGLKPGSPKRQSVTRLTEQLKRATSAVITDYRGVSVKELEELRGMLRQANIDYVVVKNTLARRAAADAGVDTISPALTGPVGLAIGYEDISTPARTLTNYFRTNRKVPVMGGLVENRLLDADGIKMVADLPSREVLLGQLAGTLNSPLSSLAGAMQSIMGQFAATLDAYRMKLEQG